jgi:hypothetical protein
MMSAHRTSFTSPVRMCLYIRMYACMSVRFYLFSPLSFIFTFLTLLSTGSLSDNSAAREVGWQYLQTHWDALNSRFATGLSSVLCLVSPRLFILPHRHVFDWSHCRKLHLRLRHRSTRRGRCCDVQFCIALSCTRVVPYTQELEAFFASKDTTSIERNVKQVGVLITYCAECGLIGLMGRLLRLCVLVLAGLRLRTMLSLPGLPRPCSNRIPPHSPPPLPPTFSPPEAKPITHLQINTISACALTAKHTHSASRCYRSALSRTLRQRPVRWSHLNHTNKRINNQSALSNLQNLHIPTRVNCLADRANMGTTAVQRFRRTVTQASSAVPGTPAIT